jgi:hypothetical protein
MGTSLVHVLTVIGKGATEVEDACDELLGRRIQRHVNRYGSEDWTEADHTAIADLCSALINAARDLPVVYYAQYVDSRSVADSRFRLVEWPDAKRRWIFGSTFGMVYYPSRHYESVLVQIKSKRRTKLYRTQTEDRWYLDHLKEATEAAIWLQAPFLVVSVSECLGGGRDDEEIKAALDMPIGLTKHGI